MKSSKELSADIDNLKKGFIIQNNRLLAAIADVVKRRLENDIKGMKLEYRGKEGSDGPRISASLVGSIITDDYDKTANDVRSAMDELKNKTNITSEIDGVK